MTMCDQWMPMIQLPLTYEQFRQLPRNPAYRYEYLNGQAYLSPRSRHYHALLDLHAMASPLAGEGGGGNLEEGVEIVRARAEDFAVLGPLFAAAFRSIQPFGSLDDETRGEAARQALERTRTGGDGPWIAQASFVARKEER